MLLLTYLAFCLFSTLVSWGEEQPEKWIRARNVTYVALLAWIYRFAGGLVRPAAFRGVVSASSLKWPLLRRLQSSQGLIMPPPIAPPWMACVHRPHRPWRSVIWLSRRTSRLRKKDSQQPSPPKMQRDQERSWSLGLQGSIAVLRCAQNQKLRRG